MRVQTDWTTLSEMLGAFLRCALLCAAATVSAAPDVTALFPVGAAPGQSVEVTASGNFPEWPVQVWSSDSDVQVVALEEKGKLQVDVAEGVGPGLIWLRLHDKTGAAVPRPWLIAAGSAASRVEAIEQEPNEGAATAQICQWASDAPQTLVLNGRLEKEGDVDVYSVPGKAGQTLVADFDGQAAFGSPVDAVIQILRSDGFVVAHNDDQQKLDPRLAVVLPTDGRWLVRVFGFPEAPDNQVRLAGGETYVYRLRLSTGPVIDYAIPSAATRGRANVFDLTGWNLSEGGERLTATPLEGVDSLWLDCATCSVPLRIPVLDCESLAEIQPTSESEPMAIEPSVSITGRIDEPGDRDWYCWQASKGDRMTVKVASRSLGFPLDPVIELLDAQNQRLARVDDDATGNDATIDHVVGVDGPLRLTVSDLYRQGGADFVYRLSVERSTPAFLLTAEAHQLIVAPGATAELGVVVTRMAGHDAPIWIVAEGLPEGVTCDAAKSNGGDATSGRVTLKFTAAADAKGAGVPFRVTGRSSKEGEELAPAQLPASERTSAVGARCVLAGESHADGANGASTDASSFLWLTVLGK